MTRRDLFKLVLGAVVGARVAPSLPVKGVWDKTRIDFIAYQGAYRGGKTNAAIKELQLMIARHMDEYRKVIDCTIFDNYEEHYDAQKRLLEIHASKSTSNICGLREAIVDSRGEEDLYFCSASLGENKHRANHSSGA